MAIRERRVDSLDYGDIVESDREFDIIGVGFPCVVGDQLHYIETDLDGEPTGRMIARTVTHVAHRYDVNSVLFKTGLMPGFMVIGFRR